MLTKLVIQKDAMTYTCQAAESQGLELNLAVDWPEITDKAFDSVHVSSSEIAIVIALLL